MKTAFLTGSMAIGMIAAQLLLSGQAFAKTSGFFDFEDGTQPWTPGMNAKSGSETLSIGAEWNGCPYVKCNHYANLKMTTADTGAVAWMLAPFYVNGGDAEFVSIDLLIRDTGGRGKPVPVIYAGPTKPSKGTDFKILHPVGHEAPAAGTWAAYHFETSTTLKDNTAYVAIGWKFGEQLLPVPAPASTTSPAPARMLRNERLFDSLQPEQFDFADMGGSLGFDDVNVAIYPEP